jgi:class 3 adenylate cyclase
VCQDLHAWESSSVFSPRSSCANSDTGSLFALCIYNDIDDTTLFFFPEHARPKYTTATECLHTPCFRNLFGDQVVNEASRFTIKRVVLVFTDVVSSTALYDEAGDGPALDIVREHFKVLFSAFASKGRIVKTVGDAVMGAFSNGEDAILAAGDALNNLVHRVHRPDGTPLQVRIGIHCGPALVVPLNGINDYFGSTVNVAARVESKADDGECLVSETVLADPATKAAFDKMLAGGYVHTRDVELSLKGVGSAIRARGFRGKELGISL